MGSATQQDQSIKQMFDHAVAMRQTQPEAALSIFRKLREDQAGPLSQAAGEQLINTLWVLRRLDAAQAESQRLMNELKSNPKQSYLYARVATRWSEIAIANGKESEAVKVLEEAEGIFQLNADFYSVGKVEQLKAAISTEQGEYEKAQIQAERGQRLIATYAPTVAPDSSRTGIPELVGAGNGRDN